MIDLDDSAPALTSSSHDLSGLFSSTAQPAQPNVMAHVQAPAQYQPPQQPPPSTYAPSPMFYNNNSNMGVGGGGMNTFMQASTPNFMTPNRQLSGTPPASIALPQSKPGSQHSTPALPAATPNYFGNTGARGPVGGSINRGMGSGGSPMSLPMGGNLGGAGMSLNGGGSSTMGMGSGPVMLHSQPPAPAATSTPAPSGQQGTDPFADLAGLF